jgi:hypothetical protein
MERLLMLAVLGGAVLAGAQSGRPADSGAKPELEAQSGDSVAMPSLPPGRTTIFGGEVTGVDPVRDRLTLKIYGARPMKIFFDERTQLFRDGKRIPLHDLRTEEHASVETMLNGSDVFAVSIHVLSGTEGEYRGHVLAYDQRTGALTIDSGFAGEPFHVAVQGDTIFAREGQPSFSSIKSGPQDLVSGSLVAVSFNPSGNGHAVAHRISVLAVPGFAFVFSGVVSSIDLASGSLVLIDPADRQDYQISFDTSRIPAARKIQTGQSLRIVANYEENRYLATEITLN